MTLIKPLKILTADDSATIRSYISKTLTLAEIPVVKYWEAKNGKEALEIMEKQQIDLLFLDLNMPIMSGQEVIDEMNRKALLKKIPVIIISAEGSEKRIEELKQKGVSDFLRKPCTPEALGDLVRRLMEKAA